MLETVQAWVPLACQAFRDYRLGAVTLSAQMLAVVRRMLAGEAVTQAGQRAEPAGVGGADGGAGAGRLTAIRGSRIGHGSTEPARGLPGKSTPIQWSCPMVPIVPPSVWRILEFEIRAALTRSW